MEKALPDSFTTSSSPKTQGVIWKEILGSRKGMLRVDLLALGTPLPKLEDAHPNWSLVSPPPSLGSRGRGCRAGEGGGRRWCWWQEEPPPPAGSSQPLSSRPQGCQSKDVILKKDRKKPVFRNTRE